MHGEYFEHECEQGSEIEESLALDSSGGISWMSFIMGGLFANLFTPKPSKPIPFQEIPNGNELNSEERQPLLTSEGEKEFLSAIWLMEKEIKLAEAEENWVRLYCLLQTVRHLSENNWKKYLEGDFPYQDFLNDNLLSLLYYVLDMNPEETYWPKVSQRVKDTLEQGGLNVELEDLSYTFKGKPLCEEPWPEDYFTN